MRPEALDTARRELLADLSRRLDVAGLDPDTLERVQSELQAFLDILLVRLDSFGCERPAPGVRAAAQFALIGIWPLALERFGYLVVMGPDDSRRLQTALATKAPDERSGALRNRWCSRDERCGC